MVTQPDKTNTAVVATIVVVGAFSMISISALLTALVRSATAEVDEVRPTHADLDTIAALDKQQIAALHAPNHWVDKPAGKIGIPIERAMQLVVADFRKDPSAASPPIPPGLVLPPAPPADGAAATAPTAVPGASTAPSVAPGAAVPGAVAPGAVAPGALVPAPGAPRAPVTSPNSVAPKAPPPSVNAPPPSGAAPSAAPGPAAPATPPVPASRKL